MLVVEVVSDEWLEGHNASQVALRCPLEFRLTPWIPQLIIERYPVGAVSAL